MPAPDDPHEADRRGRRVANGRPSPGSLLTVCAHPDDESFGLGAVVTAFTGAGADVAGLCLTHGEASTLHGVAGDLRDLRREELAAAAGILGMQHVTLLSFPDGRLDEIPIEELAATVAGHARLAGAEALLAFDEGGITGHLDHRRATEVAMSAAAALDLPVLAWVIPERVAQTLNAELGTSFRGRDPDEVDAVLRVDRRRQLRAIACHRSQSIGNPVLWRRLELLGDAEAVRWLRRPPAPGKRLDVPAFSLLPPALDPFSQAATRGGG